jgi:hypothetical protein
MILLQQSTVLAGGAAVVAAVAGLFVTQTADSTKVEEKEEEEPVKIDVSIPYNAAAKLAFEAYGVEDESKFAQFESIYLEQAVEQVKFKKWKQEMETQLAAKETSLQELQTKMDALMKKEAKAAAE